MRFYSKNNKSDLIYDMKQKDQPASPNATRWKSNLSIIALCCLLNACATTSDKADKPTATDRDIEAEFLEDRDPVANAAYWGAQYERRSNDPLVLLHYGRNLRYVGQNSKANSILSEGLTKYPDDPQLMAEYGKSLANAGRIQEGLNYLSTAAQARPNDWTIVCAQGVAYDQLENNAQAILLYNKALVLSPGNATVLNNLALSHAQLGDLEKAEGFLRDAVEQPQATAQMRLNLALILGLQGEYEEARKYAALDLPPVKVEENLAMIKAIKDEPSPWEALKALEP